MKITINSQKKIEDVQKEFQEKFPFLKLEFFKNPHKVAQGSPKNEVLSPHLLLVTVSGIVGEGVIEINPEDKVSELEKRFQQTFYLPVQVFRKSRNIWLETITTDNLTLREQNEWGQRTCKTSRERHYPIDWDQIV